MLICYNKLIICYLLKIYFYFSIYYKIQFKQVSEMFICRSNSNAASPINSRLADTYILCLISFSSINLINSCATLLIIRIKSVLIIDIHIYLSEHKLWYVNKREFLANGTNPIRRTGNFFTKITIETLFSLIMLNINRRKCAST